MAAKNKKRGRHAEAREPDIQEIFGLHLRASLRRDGLLTEAGALQAAGKIGEARKRLRAAQEIQHRLTALEAEVRLTSRNPGS
jgi:hypothetical protein